MVQIARGDASKTGSLAACLFDLDGFVLATNRDHAAILKERPEDIVGHSWREWTEHDRMRDAERIFARCVAGEPSIHTRHILRQDGSVATAQAQIMRLDGRMPLVVGLLYVRPTSTEILTRESFAVADRICDVAIEMAVIAETAGLISVRRKLLDVAAEAGRIVDRLESGMIKATGMHS